MDQLLGGAATAITTEARALAGLRAHPRNYRRHPERQLALLRESLRVHGQQKPVVITPDGTILAGHGLVEAARAEGWTQIASHVYDGPYPEAFLAIDNRASDLAEDDEAALAALLRDLDVAGDLSAAGYEEDELTQLLARIDAEAKRGREEIFDAGQAMAQAETAAGPTRVQPGDLWALGQHRVVCGDSTDAALVQRLISPAVVNLVLTDPPYNVAYNPSGSRVSKNDRWDRDGQAVLANDDLRPHDYAQLLDGALGAVIPVAESPAFYICMGYSGVSALEASMARLGIHRSAWIVWDKQRLVMLRRDYHSQYELMAYGWLEGHEHYFVDDRTQTDVWSVESPSGNERPDHPTPKPVRLFERAITNSSRPGDLVYDPFLGSGTTVIAAEKLGRVCYGIEIEPRYCDIVLARWESFTGHEAVRKDG